MDLRKLTSEQQRLVAANLGLIGVHLKRFVRTPPHPTRRCEREDLFQEGCLALARAAAEYNPDRHGAFQGFALNRIHAAISQALYEKFSLVRVPYQVARGHRPDPRRKRPGGDALQSEPVDAGSPAQSVIEDFDLSRLVARRPSRTHESTLGDRMHDLLAEAAHRAAAELTRRTRGRGDRGQMVAAVVAQRVLVPEDGEQKSLRQLARDLRCSVSRVVACEQSVLRLIRRSLADDALFRALNDLSAARAEGFASPLTPEDELELARATRRQFAEDFEGWRPAEQGAVLLRLAELVSGGAGRLAGELYALLPPQRQRDLSHVIWLNRPRDVGLGVAS